MFRFILLIIIVFVVAKDCPWWIVSLLCVLLILPFVGGARKEESQSKPISDEEIQIRTLVREHYGVTSTYQIMQDGVVVEYDDPETTPGTGHTKRITKAISWSWFKRAGVLFCLILSACATPKEWQAVSGSRADGMVRLAFDYGLFEKPVTKNGQGEQVAAQRCRAWGYQEATPFSGVSHRCIQSNQYGCIAWRVFVDFQCTGGGK